MRIKPLLIGLVFCSNSVIGSISYIAVNGNDQNPGTRARPWATFAYSLQQVRPGDTLMVRGGLYNEGEIWIRKDLGMGGSDGNYVTVMAHPGENPQLTGPRRMIVETNYIRIQGLEFLNTYSLDLPWWGEPGTREHVEILNNRFTGAFGIPLEFCGNYGLIEGNRIENSNGESHAIYLHYGHHNILRNNRILGTYKYGIHVYDEHKPEDPEGFVRRYSNVIIERNYISSSKTRAGIILGTSADAPVPGVTMDSILIRQNVIINNGSVGIYVKAWAGRISHIDIYNNTLYNNRYGGIFLDNCQYVNIFNNIIVANEGKHISADAQTKNTTVNYNLFWPAPLRSDAESGVYILENPLFINAENTNFELQASSPAIDAGTDVGLEYNGSAPDLGAFEYGDPQTRNSKQKEIRRCMLYQNFPNPFNPVTRIEYAVTELSHVKIEIINILGQPVDTLVDQIQSPGYKSILWDTRKVLGQGVPAGIYICKLMAGNFEDYKKLILLY
ncbi:T9SS type A sorting domain-containing protein [candidate division KSB1 bacterium]|nr:T9SS type A sorting domain-containing protein [candidate division KSB1 bacterium]